MPSSHQPWRTPGRRHVAASTALALALAFAAVAPPVHAADGDVVPSTAVTNIQVTVTGTDVEVTYDAAFAIDCTEGWVHPLVVKDGYAEDDPEGWAIDLPWQHLTAAGAQTLGFSLTEPGDYFILFLTPNTIEGMPSECPVGEDTTPSSGPSATFTIAEESEPPADEEPSASLSVTSISPDGEITVSGSGFEPNEPIEIWLHSTPVQLFTGNVSGTGTVSQVVTIPSGTAPGAHQIEVRGASSGSVFSDLTVLQTLAATGAEVTVGLSVAGGLLLLGTALLLLRRSRRAKHSI